LPPIAARLAIRFAIFAVADTLTRVFQRQRLASRDFPERQYTSSASSLAASSLFSPRLAAFRLHTLLSPALISSVSAFIRCAAIRRATPFTPRAFRHAHFAASATHCTIFSAFLSFSSPAYRRRLASFSSAVIISPSRLLQLGIAAMPDAAGLMFLRCAGISALPSVTDSRRSSPADMAIFFQRLLHFIFDFHAYISLLWLPIGFHMNIFSDQRRDSTFSRPEASHELRFLRRFSPSFSRIDIFTA
jgi:hypothetical protein